MNSSRESVSAILDSSTRGATIVQQLLTLARKTEPKFELVGVDSVIDELVHLFGKSFPQTIEIKLELSRHMPALLADRNQIFQALLNLCLNARDAMPNGGTLTLEDRRRQPQCRAYPLKSQRQSSMCASMSRIPARE